MVDTSQVRGLIASLLHLGKNLDPEDMSVLYGWIYSVSVALQPFPLEHRYFCENCRDSFGIPRERLNAGLEALKLALNRVQEQEIVVRENDLSPDYLKLLKKVFGDRVSPSGQKQES
jgi:hypothetical protein